MVNQPQTDAPFGLQPNVAAGLAYLLGLIGGIIMLVGGGTNRAVKWAAAQSITLWGGFFILRVGLGFLSAMMNYSMWGLFGTIFLVLNILGFVLWLWTTITAFQGKEVEVPVVAGLTRQLFASQLGGAA